MKLDGKLAVVLGVANQRSIAWAIARSLAQEGARLLLTYQNERFKESVETLAGQVAAQTFVCDVQEDGQIQALAQHVEHAHGGADILIHSLAFAPRADLEGRFIDTSREGFRVAMDVSCYSLVALARAFTPAMARRGGASMLTMTYYGSEKVIPGYNVMGVAKAALEATVRYLAHELGPSGVRVNAISAGPLNTLAARGIPHFTDMRRLHSDRAPLKRNVEAEEVGRTAVFLCGPDAAGITGEVVYVDAGYHIMGL